VKLHLTVGIALDRVMVVYRSRVIGPSFKPATAVKPVDPITDTPQPVGPPVQSNTLKIVEAETEPSNRRSDW